MTVLQMLEQRCDFIKTAVSNDRPEMEELRRMNLPSDFGEFYWETDGGTGSVFYPAYRNPCTFVLYGNEKMLEMNKWFLAYSAMLYEELYLLDERKPNEEEQERLRSVSADLVILGECGDPNWPDYMFLYKDAFFLKPRDSLDFPFHDWSVDEEECVTRHSYFDFLTKVLKSMEPFEKNEGQQ